MSKVFERVRAGAKSPDTGWKREAKRLKARESTGHSAKKLLRRVRGGEGIEYVSADDVGPIEIARAQPAGAKLERLRSHAEIEPLRTAGAHDDGRVRPQRRLTIGRFVLFALRHREMPMPAQVHRVGINRMKPREVGGEMDLSGSMGMPPQNGTIPKRRQEEQPTNDGSPRTRCGGQSRHGPSLSQWL